jgi:lipopolysaccharide export system protein LptC
MDARVKITRPPPPSREGAFRAARIHTRLVRFLKVAVPATAATGVCMFIFFAWFNPFREVIAIPVPDSPVKDGTVVMSLPILSGTNSHGQSYNVTAITAAQKVTAPGLVDLADLKAIIDTADKSKANLSASTGKFDSNAQILNLKDNVHVVSTKGYDVTMKSATVDFKANTVVSIEPVTVNLSNGTIFGNNLNIVQGGSKITFAGGVSAHFKTQLKAPTDDSSTPDDDTDDADPTGSTTDAPANTVQGSPSQ